MRGSAIVVVAALVVAACATGADVTAAGSTTNATTSPPTTIVATTSTLALGDPADAAVCYDLGETPLDPPTTEVAARAYFQLSSGFLEFVDPQIPEVIEQRWADVTAGYRALRAAYEAADEDFRAIDFDAPEFAFDAAAAADIVAWCRTHGIEPGSPRPRPEPVVEPRPEPPAECDGSSFSLYLGTDDELDWMVSSGSGVVSSEAVPWLVCDSERDDVWSFDGPGYFESIFTVDIDDDRVDDFLMIGGTTVSDVIVSVWGPGPDRGEFVPVLDADDLQLGVTSGGWWPDIVYSPAWFGCGDLDGDGISGLLTGAYDSVNGETVWTGEELQILDGRVVGSQLADGRIADPEVYFAWDGPFRCMSATEVRAAR